jgi:triacylglycerol lipase
MSAEATVNLVFASGYLMPQRLLGFEYFRGVAAAFPGALFPVVPPVGTVTDRARSLADQIATAFPTGTIHVIAHSMGGLDARSLLAANLEGLASPQRVVSLSTISTPHRGSPIADLLVGEKPDVLDPRRFIYDTLLEAFHDLHVPSGALGNLTSDFARHFNADTPDVQHISYFSYAGAGMNSFLLKPGHLFISSLGNTPNERANDGLVSVASATWGQWVESPWPADHLAEVGHDLNAPDLRPAFDYLSAIRRIVSHAGNAAN